MQKEINARDRARADICLKCTVCAKARKEQKGFAYWLVKKIEGGLCPCCQAYERVYGHKAHEPIPVNG
ncbi:MAG: hypothetical protein JW901_05115 [Dehalococcoidia bacterium]|nr:hypothetical protein [Dehalococcoidia bacterium]